MAHEENRPPRPRDRVHLPKASLLEVEVPDGEDLVHDQNLRLEERRYREGEAKVHPARVPLHRRVDEPLHLGERDDLGELRRDFPPPHPEHGTTQEDVLAPCQLRVEAGTDLQKTRDRSMDFREARRRPRDPREDLQKGRLAGSVPSDDSQDLAAAHLEAHVPEGPDRRLFLSSVTPALERGHGGFRDPVAEGLVLVDRTDPELLPELLDSDDDVAHQMTSEKVSSVAWK